MMLQALIGYAERERLGGVDASFFQPVDVRWELPLDHHGKLTGGPIPLSENPDEKKPRPKRFIRPFTSPNELNQGDKSHFLCDSLERAALFLDPKSPEKAAGRRVQHAYFKALLAGAATGCPTEAPRLQAVLALLNDADELDALHRQLAAAKAKPTDNAFFAVEGRNFLDSSELQEFWRQRRRGSPSVGAELLPMQRVCLATGKLDATLDTTDKIKGVPGGLAVGTNLISFDKDAFCSYGLEQAQNAALSAPAELKIRSALNQLIENSRSQKLVFNDTAHLHWTREPVPIDPTDLLVGAEEEKVAALLRSVRDGEQIYGVEANAYYAMSLSGNGARIVVRDWLESTVAEITRNVAKWFLDLALVHPDGLSVRHDFKFGALLYGLVRAELDELPPALPTQLFHAALRGRGVLLPQTALAAALRRQQLDQENKLHPARLALIKACLLRLQNLPHAETRSPANHMTESLNHESRDAAYLCGRLFAVFDRLQHLALGGVNAGVVERYYASASVTPSLVMGRLFRNAQFHLAKADGGVAENVRKDFETLASALGDHFPPTLDLEAQGRFALGYYHQKAEYRRRTAERKETAALREEAVAE